MTRLFPLSEFAASPVGHAVLSRHTLLWYCAPRLSVVAMWGRPDRQDIDLLAQAMDADWAFRTEPFLTLVDLRGLHTLDEDVVAQYAAVLHTRKERQRRILRCAVILPTDGWLVRAVATIGPMLSPLEDSNNKGMQYGVSADLLSALSWLDWKDASCLQDLAMLTEKAQAESRASDELRRFLTANLTSATLVVAAKDLGISARTLQRRLRDAQTTFLDELTRVRIERAKELLTTTDKKLFSIAQEVGYKKQQNFTSAFRKVVNQSPPEWRNQMRNVAKLP